MMEFSKWLESTDKPIDEMIAYDKIMALFSGNPTLVKQRIEFAISTIHEINAWNPTHVKQFTSFHDKIVQQLNQGKKLGTILKKGEYQIAAKIIKTYWRDLAKVWGYESWD